jgi:hypothetical protein
MGVSDAAAAAVFLLREFGSFFPSSPQGPLQKPIRENLGRDIYMEFSSAFPKTLTPKMQFERATAGKKQREVAFRSLKQHLKCDKLIIMQILMRATH